MIEETGGELSPPSVWDIRFLALAKHISNWSKDPSTKVGSVIVDDHNRIISLGYNGLPRGIDDTNGILDDRNSKLKSIIHAEVNALLFAQTTVKGMTIYTWPFMPCSNCCSIIIQSGITRVVAPKSDNTRWIESFQISTKLFNEAKVVLDLISESFISTE